MTAARKLTATIVLLFPSIAISAAPVDQWEYAILIERNLRGRNVPNPPPQIEWITGDRAISAEDWDALSKKLEFPADKPNNIKDASVSTYNTRYITTLNHLGAQGWELAGVQQPAESPRTTWTFKRRLAK